MVTRLALVALKVFDGLGVYWGNACVCNSREVFEDFCGDVSEEHVPVPMWNPFPASTCSIRTRITKLPRLPLQVLIRRMSCQRPSVSG